MERCLLDRVYWIQLEVTVVDLMNLLQKVDESVVEFIARYRKTTRKCSVQFPKSQLTSMAISRMHPQLSEKLVGQTCIHLNNLAF